MPYFKTANNEGFVVLDESPGPDWVEVTEAEYNTLTASAKAAIVATNLLHPDVHLFLDKAGITDPEARSAFHRLVIGADH